MDYLNNFNQGLQLQTLLSEAKVILSKEGDINAEKENLTQIINRVDFILGKHDELYEKFSSLFMAMGDFDFSKRLEFVDDGEEVINFIISGLNMLNDEYQSSVINKKILHSFFKAVSFQNLAAVITDTRGFIYFADSANPQLQEFNDNSLSDQSITTIFVNYKTIENRINEEGSIKNISSEIKWRGKVIPVSVDVSVCNNLGKIESLIYIIKLDNKI